MYFIFSFLFSFITTYLVVRYEHLHAHITSDSDLNSIQKFHTNPVPRVGGIGVMAGLLGVGLFQFVSGNEVGNIALLLVIVVIPAFGMGLLEDLTKKISVRARLLGTSMSAVLGGLVLDAWFPSTGVIFIDEWLSVWMFLVVATCFAVAGVSNAFNLIDGYNGLAGKPQQNAFIERFNRTYRHEVLNAYLFDDLDQAREITEAWIKSYNEERPHRALGKLPPKSFRQQ